MVSKKSIDGERYETWGISDSEKANSYKVKKTASENKCGRKVKGHHKQE